MTITNKRLLISESHGDSNRCTPCKEKPDQHDTYASHTSPHTPGVRFLWVVPVHGNLSRDANRFGQISVLPKKWAPNTIHSTPADRSMGPYPASLLSQTMKQGGKPSSWWWSTTRFIIPISPACDWYVQYFLMGANPSVLNRHRWGLQPWRCRLATYPFFNLPNQLSPLSPSGLARSLF
jgi:hypothetical protein